MSGVELKPCGLSAGSNILVPLGTTTIGRGPFLSIADKRVSRNHAILEIDNGVFRVKPIHVNPTFFADKSDLKLKPLRRDEWKQLENGSRISLTPNEHIFEVVVDDRPVQGSLTQSPRSSVGAPSPVKLPPEESPTKPVSSEHDDEKAPSPACRKLEFDPGENNGSTAGEETNGQPEEAKEQGDKGTSRDKDEGEESKPARSDTEECAKPVERKRELPAWMANLAPSGDQKEAPAPAAKPKAAPKKPPGRPKKRGADSIDDEGEEERATKPPVKKRAPPAPRNRRKAASPKSQDEGDDDEEAPPPELKKKTSSRGRPTRRVSYVDEVDDDDEDYDAAKDGYYEGSGSDGDDGSDWESENTPKKGKKGKGKGPRGAKGKKGRRGRRSYSDESSDDDVYIPKPTKRTAKKMSSSQRSSDEEEAATPPRKRRKNDKRRGGEDSEDNDKERESCTYGAKCYRKNPAHLREFSHPGDDDHAEEEEAEEVNEEDKSECPYGAECYRKNPDHRKQFKHLTATTTGRPKRQARQGRKKAADGDDDAPDTYDYEDSFLDDEEGETPKGRKSDDSDFDPTAGEDSEDVSQLVKEAKGYIKNKKMQKPV